MIWPRWLSANSGRIGSEEPTQSLVWKRFGSALPSHRVCWSSSPTTDSKDDRNGCRPGVSKYRGTRPTRGQPANSAGRRCVRLLDLVKALPAKLGSRSVRQPPPSTLDLRMPSAELHPDSRRSPELRGGRLDPRRGPISAQRLQRLEQRQPRPCGRSLRPAPGPAPHPPSSPAHQPLSRSPRGSPRSSPQRGPTGRRPHRASRPRRASSPSPTPPRRRPAHPGTRSRRCWRSRQRTAIRDSASSATAAKTFGSNASSRHDASTTGCGARLPHWRRECSDRGGVPSRPVRNN